MTQNETVSTHAPTIQADTSVADTGKVRVGAGFRLLPPAAAPAEVSDAGAVRVGAGFRLATH